jgi:hypothetical protein
LPPSSSSKPMAANTIDPANMIGAMTLCVAEDGES